MNPCLSLMVMLSLTCCAADHHVVRKDGLIDFHLRHDRAREVYFASSADDFQLHRLRQEGDGSWLMDDLADREFTYFYRIDGELYLPDCRYRENDDFGRQNCLHQP